MEWVGLGHICMHEYLVPYLSAVQAVVPQLDLESVQFLVIPVVPSPALPMLPTVAVIAMATTMPKDTTDKRLAFDSAVCIHVICLEQCKS